MNKINKQIIIFFANLILTVMIGSQISNYISAQDNTHAPFTIKAVEPENQINNSKNKSYLDLLVTPDSEQNIEFDISNLSDKKQHFVLELSDATTSNGLSIDYGKTNNKIIGSPKMSDMISPENSHIKLAVPPLETIRVTVPFKYPSQKFDGLILGGATISMDEDYENSTSKPSGIGISSKFRYALGIQLRSDVNSYVKPNLQLIDAKQDSDNYHPIIRTTLQNNKPSYISQMNTSFTLENQNGEIIEKQESTLGQVAPISEFELLFRLSKGSLKPGIYTLSGHVNSKKTGDSWDFKKSINVDNDNFNKTNSNDVTKTNRSIPWYLIIIVLLFIIIFILLVIIFKKRKQK
ncbi:DUF3324 domain-containing protein [Holzapfeliella sp. He02]|uniref:DUF3324 domain-containing protein n=1 Tax=Holzapfeliella saturejae TaxID=3082953 RepID=A0ABU8SE53_9LACO